MEMEVVAAAAIRALMTGLVKSDSTATEENFREPNILMAQPMPIKAHMFSQSPRRAPRIKSSQCAA
jgi:hypothetical protein